MSCAGNCAGNYLTIPGVSVAVFCMTTPAKRRGRKAKPFRFEGKYINGLRKRPSDGRWELSDGRTFTEPDERRAVERFRKMVGATDLESLEAALTTSHSRTTTEVKAVSIERVRKAAAKIAKGFGNDNEGWMYMPDPSKDIWLWFADQIHKRKEYVAEKCGMEQLGYLDKVQAPEPLPSLAALEETWKAHAKCTKRQKAKVTKAWKDFVATTGIKAIDEITATVAVAYADNLHGRDISGKHQQHLLDGIKRMLSFSKSRAIAVKPIAAAMEYLKLMQPNAPTHNLEPTPISVGDWKRLLSVANGMDKAMILLMLNACLYAGEVIVLQWDDISEGNLIGRRRKQGEFIRVATLWDETKAALDELSRKGPFILRSATGTQLKSNGAFIRFRKLVVKAKKEAAEDHATMNDVKPSHLRDAAYTTAVAANVSFPLCQLLAGHSSGMADHYVQASPSIVAPACKAIHSKYFAS
jgi:integrase